MKLLSIDATIRKQSRTRELLETFKKHVSSEVIWQEIQLTSLPLKPLMNEQFELRESLLSQHNLAHPFFDLAHQFQQADIILITAPFWDLSFPSILKIYIENICVEGITFISTDHGLKGHCHAKKMILLTTRGGNYTNHPDESAIPYLQSLCHLWGIESFEAIAADGMDIINTKALDTLEQAKIKVKELAITL